MNKILMTLVAGLMISGSAFSGEMSAPVKNPENFQEVQKRVIEHLTKRQEQLSQEMSCVKAAKAHEDFQKCRTQAREFHEQMREDMHKNFCEGRKDNPRCNGERRPMRPDRNQPPMP